MSFTGGKLKLKGGEGLPGVKKKKKKDASSTAIALAGSEGINNEDTGTKDEAAEDLKRALHGYALKALDEGDDRRTPAEKKYDARMKMMEGERLKKMATKSHREKIKDFNDHLNGLSEHHDIPKVGPG